MYVSPPRILHIFSATTKLCPPVQPELRASSRSEPIRLEIVHWNSYHSYERRVYGLLEPPQHFPRRRFLSTWCPEACYMLILDALQALVKHSVDLLELFGSIIGSLPRFVGLRTQESWPHLAKLHQPPRNANAYAAYKADGITIRLRCELFYLYVSCPLLRLPPFRSSTLAQNPGDWSWAPRKTAARIAIGGVGSSAHGPGQWCSNPRLQLTSFLMCPRTQIVCAVRIASSLTEQIGPHRNDIGLTPVETRMLNIKPTCSMSDAYSRSNLDSLVYRQVCPGLL